MLDGRSELLELLEVELAAPVRIHLLEALTQVLVGRLVALLAETDQLAKLLKVNLPVP